MGFGKKTLAAFAALSLTVSPVVAQAAKSQQPVAERTAEARDAESNIKGSSAIVGLLALSAIIAGLIIVTNKKKNTPTSP